MNIDGIAWSFKSIPLTMPADICVSQSANPVSANSIQANGFISLPPVYLEISVHFQAIDEPVQLLSPAIYNLQLLALLTLLPI